MHYIHRLEDNSDQRSEFMKKMVPSAIVKENKEKIAFLTHFMEKNGLDGQTEILKLTNFIENFQFRLFIPNTPYEEHPSANFGTTNYSLVVLEFEQKTRIVPRDSLLELKTTSETITSFLLRAKKRILQVTSKKIVLLIRSNESQKVSAGSKLFPELWISICYLSLVGRIRYKLQHFMASPIEYIPSSPLSHSEYIMRK